VLSGKDKPFSTSAPKRSSTAPKKGASKGTFFSEALAVDKAVEEQGSVDETAEAATAAPEKELAEQAPPTPERKGSFKVHYVSGQAFVGLKQVNQCLVTGSENSADWEYPDIPGMQAAAGVRKNTCSNCTVECSISAKFCPECGHKLDVQMPEQSELRRRATAKASAAATRSQVQEAVRQAELALEKAKADAAALAAEGSEPESLDDIELEWEVVQKARHARAKASGKGGSYRPSTRVPREERIRLSADELLELLPFLGKEDKKRLQRQLLQTDDSAASSSSNKGKGKGATDPAIAHRAQAFSTTLTPEVPKPKAQLKAELEQWRREMYIQKLDKNGRLIPSACAKAPKGAQVTCSHPFESLRWGANGAAQYASCSACKLQHAVYYDTAAKEVLMVGPAPPPAADPPPQEGPAVAQPAEQPNLPADQPPPAEAPPAGQTPPEEVPPAEQSVPQEVPAAEQLPSQVVPNLLRKHRPR
jgi:hypothetical protein